MNKSVLDYISSNNENSEYSVENVLFIYEIGEMYYEEIEFNNFFGNLLYFAVNENCTKTNEKALRIIDGNNEILNGFVYTMINKPIIQCSDEKERFDMVIDTLPDLKNKWID